LFSVVFFSSCYVPFYLQQNNIFKAREEKYHSRIRVLEALASGTEEEKEVYTELLQSTYIDTKYKLFYLS